MALSSVPNIKGDVCVCVSVCVWVKYKSLAMTAIDHSFLKLLNISIFKLTGPLYINETIMNCRNRVVPKGLLQIHCENVLPVFEWAFVAM